MARRRRALTIAAMCFAALIGLNAPGAAADSPPPSPPRTNSTNETVYLVKGYNPIVISQGVNCESRWGRLIEAMQDWGWKKEQFVQVGFYTADTLCNINLAPEDGDRDLSLKELGRRLAWDVYRNHSSKGESVDLVGHSMGGLIVRAAVLGVTYHDPAESWPPFLYVEDAVTLGTPHYGTGKDCDSIFGADLQCRQMLPGSQFMTWLHSTQVPQPTKTDWTFIGSNADTTVSRNSATPTIDGAQHLVRYRKSEGIGHSALRVLAKGTKRLYYRNYGSSRWTTLANGAAPVHATSNALYWATKW
ncbi:hypothetical protein CP981_37190 [Streptomyces platensis]|uniref:PGAP1-like protein n=1 Tax=Streptomyces platensis TaxID=58346 RepID=A0AAE6NNV9_STRPT|nr:PGAP1-like protein [Streptomyces platensis]QEV56474.1 hypothetical protein CP981_37190 [Streptomyces platensis]